MYLLLFIYIVFLRLKEEMWKKVRDDVMGDRGYVFRGGRRYKGGYV